MQSWINANIYRWNNGEYIEVADKIVTEAPLQIMLKSAEEAKVPVSITMRTPGEDAALAVGFLYGEGILKPGMALSSMQESEDTIVVKTAQRINMDQSVSRNFYMTSSCGVCGKASIDALKIHRPPLKDTSCIQLEMIDLFYQQMNSVNSAYSLTGGCHSAGVFSFEGTTLAISEDVGRHNAVDKCTGKIILNGCNFEQSSILCLSGRSCYELIQKGVMMNCSIIVSVGAASSLAIETATAMGVTLIGFYKPNKFNIYSHAFRVIN